VLGVFGGGLVVYAVTAFTVVAGPRPSAAGPAAVSRYRLLTSRYPRSYDAVIDY